MCFIGLGGGGEKKLKRIVHPWFVTHDSTVRVREHNGSSLLSFPHKIERYCYNICSFVEYGLSYAHVYIYNYIYRRLDILKNLNNNLTLTVLQLNNKKTFNGSIKIII